MIADLDGDRLRAYLAAHGRPRARPDRRATSREIQTGRSGDRHELLVRRPDRLRPRLKPDVAAPGARSSRRHAATPADRSRSSTGRAWRRRTSPAPPRCSCSATRAGRAAQVKSALDVDRRARRGRTPRARSEAPVCSRAAGSANVAAADDPLVFTDPQSLSFGDLDVTTGAQQRRCSSPSRTRATAPAPGRSQVAPAGADGRRRRSTSRARHRSRPAARRTPGRRARAPPARRPATTTASSSSARRRDAPDPVRVPRHAARARATRRSMPLRQAPDRRHAARHEPRRRPTAARPRRSGPPPTRTPAPPMTEDGAETAVRRATSSEPVANVGAVA